MAACGLLQAGVEPMAVRHRCSVAVAYGVFPRLLWAWLRTRLPAGVDDAHGVVALDAGQGFADGGALSGGNAAGTPGGFARQHLRGVRTQRADAPPRGGKWRRVSARR